jgi:CheY-specific phosphatase CheX
MTANNLGANGIVFSNNFIKAVQDIMSSSTNLSLTPENASEEDERNYPSFVTGLMIMHGEKDMVLSLSFSKMAAAELVVSMLDVKYNQINENDVYDAIKETTNMVAGRLKTATMNLGVTYQLTTPFVFVGSNHFWFAQSRPMGVVKKFKDKHYEMLAGVFFL